MLEDLELFPSGIGRLTEYRSNVTNEVTLGMALDAAAGIAAVENFGRLMSELSDHPGSANIGKINAWAKANGVSWRFVGPIGIRRLALSYGKRGLLGTPPKPVEELYLEANGFIDSDLWNLMLRDGILPLGDPHDLLGHAPSLAIPRLADLMRTKAVTYLKVREAYDRSQGAAKLADWAGVTLRNNTWEGTIFPHEKITTAGKEWRLAGYGNVALNLTAALVKSLEHHSPATREVGLALRESLSRYLKRPFLRAKSSYDDLASQSISSVPNMQSLLAKHNPALLEKITRLEGKLGLVGGDFEQLEARYDALVNDGVRILAESHQKTTRERIDNLYGFLAKRIAGDAFFRDAFSQETRLDYFDASLQAMELYVNNLP